MHYLYDSALVTDENSHEFQDEVIGNVNRKEVMAPDAGMRIGRWQSPSTVMTAPFSVLSSVGPWWEIRKEWLKYL